MKNARLAFFQSHIYIPYAIHLIVIYLVCITLFIPQTTEPYHSYLVWVLGWLLHEQGTSQQRGPEKRASSQVYRGFNNS